MTVRQIAPARTANGDAYAHAFGKRRVAITFDEEMFRRISRHAKSSGISFAEAVRRLVDAAP